jgi:membrane associated rhomboid family serine protease
MSNFQYYRPNAFPPVIKNLIIINALMFFAQVTFFNHSDEFTNLLALHDIRSDYFKPYQLLTYMFMHGSFEHILFNMLALWMFGAQLENVWGSKRFLQYYVLTGLGAAVLHLAVLYFEMTPYFESFNSLPPELQNIITAQNKNPHMAATVGASGSVFGCLAAFGYLFPNTLIYVYFLIPIKAKWFVILYGIVELSLGIRNSAGDTVAHFAHLGGAITGLIIVFIWNKKNRRTLY